jgi:hypothetical protein
MVKYFRTNSKFLGRLPAGKMVEAKFEALPNIPKIQTMTSSCGCSVPKFDGVFLNLKFTPDYVPLHLKPQGEYETNKHVTIFYETGEKEIVTFSAKIYD